MENNQRKLSLLKSELEFVKNGVTGEAHDRRGGPLYIFEESQSCPNFFDRTRQHRCRDCWLTEFVPANLRDEQVPCRYVELGDGVTVDSLYRCGTVSETEQMLTDCLQTRIRELEIELVGAVSLAVEQR
jgi:hypothetical protein